MFCDNADDGGGWTVIQRRGDYGDPQDSFYRNWTEYKKGFGSPNGQLWLGLDSIFYLTNKEPVQLKIELEDFEGNRTAVIADEFKINDEPQGYQ